MSDKYILEGHRPVKVSSVKEWGEWFERGDRQVASTTGNGIHVSTVFIGLDHSFGGPKPLLFETMIFGGKHDEYQERYSTWEEAEEGHREACELAGLPPSAASSGDAK